MPRLTATSHTALGGTMVRPGGDRKGSGKHSQKDKVVRRSHPSNVQPVPVPGSIQLSVER